MKKLLIALLIFTACSTNQENWFLWKPADRGTTELTIKKNLDLINFLPHEQIDSHLDNFFLIDIDKDNDLDIAYQGWNGAESNCVKFFLNKNGKYSDSAFAWGDINSITESNNDNFIMDINSPGCCGDYEIRNYKIEAIVKKDALELNFFDVKIHHGETKAPKNIFANPIDFKVLNDTYHLRVTPEIDTTNYFFPGDEPAGNTYVEYKTGDRGKALGHQTDKTGRVWWYVEMESNQRHSRTENDDSIIYPKFKGWMSSRFLEKI